jgi:hypothetical protein
MDLFVLQKEVGTDARHKVLVLFSQKIISCVMVKQLYSLLCRTDSRAQIKIINQDIELEERLIRNLIFEKLFQYIPLDQISLEIAIVLCNFSPTGDGRLGAVQSTVGK